MPYWWSLWRRWKLRWQSQAAHFSGSGAAGMNSQQPSSTWPPVAAAWLRRHSRYLSVADGALSASSWADPFLIGPLRAIGEVEGIRGHGEALIIGTAWELLLLLLL